MSNLLTNSKIWLYNRETKLLEEEVIFEKKLITNFYDTKWGLFFTNQLLVRKFISTLYALYCNSILSKRKIYKVIHRYHFNLREIEKPLHHFKSFNDFFTRSLKQEFRPIVKEPHILISPADGKLLVYSIKDSTVLPVKGRPYSIGSLLKNENLAQEYRDGYCLVFRLAPMDYHRFHYMDDGSHTEIINIEGKYHSVHPFALGTDISIFPENKRHYTVLHTKNFGDVLYMEVGAMMVGRIKQNHPKGTQFEKGQEKGAFEFGGSTIILIFKKNHLQIDPDILEQSANKVETIVKFGSGIGQKFFTKGEISENE
jgi:phosphatidylserine decarboxylase